MKASKWLLLAVWATLMHLAAQGQVTRHLGHKDAPIPETDTTQKVKCWRPGVNFRFRVDGARMVLDSAMVVNGRGPVTVELCRMYISDIEFLEGENVVMTLPKRHHLLDAEDKETWWIYPEGLCVPKTCDGIRFSLGIDSLTNVSGALGGDLDPTLGMYWAWQSGYVNMKIEGTNPNCPARGNRFQYHLGGYSGAFNAIQRVKLPITDLDKALVILVDIGAFLRQVNIAEEYEVMSPGLRAVELSRMAVDMFRIAP